MLRSLNEMLNYTIDAADGDIGRCKDFLLDDQFWTIRYVVVDTGRWLPCKKVLISPVALGEPEWHNRLLQVTLNKAQIENSPPLQEHEPVSRQYERRYFDYYNWPYYWTGGHIWGITEYPHLMPVKPVPKTADTEEEKPGDNHLRSVKEVTGYNIQAADGAVGHVEDYIVDDETWTIRYMVVDTRNWLPGRKVLVAPQWISSVDWIENKVYVNLSREAVKKSPEYDPSQPVNREYEIRLYDFYGRPAYWL